MLLAILSIGSYSCKEDETEVLSCNEKAEAYNDAIQNFSDYLDDEESEANCDDLKTNWNPVVSAYNDLCDETKTTEVTESYTELLAVVQFYGALIGCDL